MLLFTRQVAIKYNKYIDSACDCDDDVDTVGRADNQGQTIPVSKCCKRCMNDANKNMNNRQSKQPVFRHFFENIEIKNLPASLNRTSTSSSLTCVEVLWIIAYNFSYNCSLVMTNAIKLIVAIIASQSWQMCPISSMFQN